MKRPLFSAIYIFTLLTAGFTIHQAFAERSPSVEPITEISIEENRPVLKVGETDHGFDFAMNTEHEKADRVPANFVSKSKNTSSPYSYIGPLIFLIALPFSLWIAVSKKMKAPVVSDKADFYPKTFQFKPYKADFHDQESDHEDRDLPKAS